MECNIRAWEIGDVARLAEMLNNRNILNNLRNHLLIIQRPVECLKKQVLNMKDF